jgi:hypothetical protein
MNATTSAERPEALTTCGAIPEHRDRGEWEARSFSKRPKLTRWAGVIRRYCAHLPSLRLATIPALMHNPFHRSEM